jgi:DNA-binding MarR family transcriptional regulator
MVVAAKGRLAMVTVEREQVVVLQDVSFRLTRRLRKHSNTDLSLSQMSALSTLLRHGPMRVGDLARREQISKSSATRLVARLESTGYLDRQIDPRDARSFYLTITEEGHSYLAAARERANDYLLRQVDALSDQDRTVLLSALPVLTQLITAKR